MIDPQWAPVIAAVAALATALGLNERRRRRRPRKPPPYNDRVAETFLAQWKAVLEATQARADWERDERRRCEERNEVLEGRIDEMGEKVRILEWESARRDWMDSKRRKPRRQDDGGG